MQSYAYSSLSHADLLSARLWGTICEPINHQAHTQIRSDMQAFKARHKFNTFYGEDHAKISRMQRRFEATRIERTCILKLGSALLFGMPKTRSAELDSLSVDELTYVVHWREFATELIHGWRESSCMVCSTARLFSHCSARVLMISVFYARLSA